MAGYEKLIRSSWDSAFHISSTASSGAVEALIQEVIEVPRLMRTIGVAAIAGVALSAGVAGGAQASNYGYHDDDARAEIRVEKRLDYDRAEFELRKKVEHGDARFELRVKKRVDVENHYGYHDVEKRVEIRVEVRH